MSGVTAEGGGAHSAQTPPKFQRDWFNRTEGSKRQLEGHRSFEFMMGAFEADSGKADPGLSLYNLLS